MKIHPLTFLWSIIRPYRYLYLMMLMAPIISNISPMMYHYAVKLLIDLFTQNEKITLTQSYKPFMWFLLAQLAVDGPWRIHNFAQLKAIPYVFQDMMDKICKHCFNLSYTYFQNNLAGSIIGRVRGICDKYLKIHRAIEYGLSKPLFTTLYAGIALAFINLKILAFITAFIAIYLPLSLHFFTKLAKMEQARQNAWYHLFGIVADCIANIFTILSFSTKQQELDKIQDQYRRVHNPLAIQYYTYDLIIGIVLSLVYWIYLIAIFAYVIHLRNIGEISIGDIAFIISLTFIFAENSWLTTMAAKDFLENLASFRSAFEIMQVPLDTIDKETATELKVTKGTITLQDVSFAYQDGSPVLGSLNLAIKAGQKVGIVGHSGAGKSTLIALLLKNFKATSGDILIDNQSIYDVSSDSLRRHIALIPQDTILFHRSISENIGYAKENATQTEIENAAKAAHIHDYIDTLPEKYNTLVGERGIKLSGGQRQRIAIARAILKRAPILILDEATASLDSQSEQEIQRSINAMLDVSNMTVISIAHRLSTIKHMDRIIVIDRGAIAEDGSFEELMHKENGKFKKLWEHQSHGFV